MSVFLILMTAEEHRAAFLEEHRAAFLEEHRADFLDMGMELATVTLHYLHIKQVLSSHDVESYIESFSRLNVHLLYLKLLTDIIVLTRLRRSVIIRPSALK